jgi:hypothetical protein
VLSALKRTLPLLLVAGFVLWALWRHRVVGDRPQRIRPLAQPDPVDTADSLDQPDSPQSSPTPVRWEPPVKSAPPVPPRPTGVPAPGGEADPASRRRGRIEDLLERARHDDEGAA